jgi:hypothetical protein
MASSHIFISATPFTNRTAASVTTCCSSSVRRHFQKTGADFLEQFGSDSGKEPEERATSFRVSAPFRHAIRRSAWTEITFGNHARSRRSRTVPYPLRRDMPHSQQATPHRHYFLMKRKIAMLAATSVLAFSSLLVGCDRTVSKTESSSVSSDGTVKSREKTVTEKSDGTVIKKEETKKTTPNP